MYVVPCHLTHSKLFLIIKVADPVNFIAKSLLLFKLFKDWLNTIFKYQARYTVLEIIYL